MLHTILVALGTLAGGLGLAKGLDGAIQSVEEPLDDIGYSVGDAYETRCPDYVPADILTPNNTRSKF